jgi:hypothetical protein
MLLDGTAKISDCGTAAILSRIMPLSGFIYAQQALNSHGFAPARAYQCRLLTYVPV